MAPSGMRAKAQVGKLPDNGANRNWQGMLLIPYSITMWGPPRRELHLAPQHGSDEKEEPRSQLTMRWLERHALGSKTAHQSGDKELQIQTPRHSNIWQAICSDSELVSPLIVTAVRMKEELQPRTILKGHFLETNKVMWSRRWQEAAPQ